MTLNTKLLIDNLIFPESPRWREDKLWFVDMYAGRILSIDLEGRAQTIAESSGWLSGLGWTPEGQLLVVSMIDRQLMRLENNGLVSVSDLSNLASFHCNDMVISTDGVAYIGNFGFDIMQGQQFKTAELISVGVDGKSRIAANELAFPNGMVITPDGGTLIVAESFNNCLTAFDICSDGTLENRRIWASIENFGPDGICLDDEGGVWVASPILGEVLRVLEGGEITHRIKPGYCPYACMLGGLDRKTLFVCQSSPMDKFSINEKKGCIEHYDVDVPGVGLP